MQSLLAELVSAKNENARLSLALAAKERENAQLQKQVDAHPAAIAAAEALVPTTASGEIKMHKDAIIIVNAIRTKRARDIFDLVRSYPIGAERDLLCSLMEECGLISGIVSYYKTFS